MRQMTDAQALVKTVDFQLNIQSNNEGLLEDATLESRWAYNETIRLAKQGVDWDEIPDRGLGYRERASSRWYPRRVRLIHGKPRGRTEDGVFRDDERRSLSNHLTPRRFTQLLSRIGY
jgi:hypothetical protein